MDFKFFDNLDENIYVSDMDTFDIVYLNKKAKKTLNISDIDSLSCKKCYKIIRQKEHPCHDCTNCLLKEGDFHEWHIFNKNFNRPFKLNDTMIVKDGRSLRFELAADMSREESLKKVQICTPFVKRC